MMPVVLVGLGPPERACPDCDGRGYQYCECDPLDRRDYEVHPRQHDCLRCEGRASIPIPCHQCEERPAVELLAEERWLCRACADIDRELARPRRREDVSALAWEATRAATEATDAAWARKVPVIKRCSCGAAHTPESWAHLRLVGIQWMGATEALELRDCACGSTLALSADGGTATALDVVAK